MTAKYKRGFGIAPSVTTFCYKCNEYITLDCEKMIYCRNCRKKVERAKCYKVYRCSWCNCVVDSFSTPLCPGCNSIHNCIRNEQKRIQKLILDECYHLIFNSPRDIKFRHIAKEYKKLARNHLEVWNYAGESKRRGLCITGFCNKFKYVPEIQSKFDDIEEKIKIIAEDNNCDYCFHQDSHSFIVSHKEIGEIRTGLCIFKEGIYGVFDADEYDGTEFDTGFCSSRR